MGSLESSGVRPVKNNDIPYLTEHEIRAVIYIHEVETEHEEEPTISELVDLTGWQSKYYTRAWQRLEPQNLVERKVDGKNTRLTLTETGQKTASKLMELNEVLDQ